MKKLKIMGIKGFLIDLDGVIFSEAPKLHYDAFTHALISFGYPAIPPELHDKEYNGMGTKEKLRKWLPSSVSESEICSINNKKQEATIQLIRETVRPDYETVFFLRYLSENFPIAVVTNCLRPTAELILNYMEVTKYFKSKIVTASEVKRKKPFPDPYLDGAQILNLNPTECLAIDDSPIGCQAAIDAGCYTWHLKHPSSLRLSRLWTVMDLLKNQQVVEL